MITEKEIYDKLSEDEARTLKEVCRRTDMDISDVLKHIIDLEKPLIEQEKKKLN